MTISPSKEKKNLQSIIFQGTPVIYLSINSSANIKTGYGF